MTASGVGKAVQNLFTACKGLPFEDGSVLGRRTFVWGAFGTMQLDFMAAALSTHRTLGRWFSGAGAKLMKALPELAVCAAVNPCTGDFVFAMEGMGVSDIPIRGVTPPAYATIKEAGVKALGWSSGGNLGQDFTAWDPFELYAPFGDAPNFSPQTYKTSGKFLVQLEAKVEAGFGAPMKDYIPALSKAFPDLVVGVVSKLTGLVVWGSDARGWQLLLRGSTAPPALNILDLFTLPSGLVGYELTVHLNSRDGPRGHFNLVFKYDAAVRLAEVLKNISPFGEKLASLLDGDDANPVRASSGFEVHFAAMRGNGFGFAVSAGVGFTDGMAKLVSKIPGLDGLSSGANVNLGVTINRDAKGQWGLAVTAKAAAQGKSYGGVLYLPCLSFDAILLGLDCD